MNSDPSGNSRPSAGSDCDQMPPWAPCEQLDQTLREIQSMYAHATFRGMAIPPETAKALEELIGIVGTKYEGDGHGKVPVKAVAKALDLHARLSALVAPAKPSTLVCDAQLHGSWAWLRHYPSVAAIAVAGLGGLALFAIFGRAVVGTQNQLQALSTRGQLACAGAAILGAGFYSTFEASKYLIERSYDYQYTHVYVIRFLLGIVAGMLMANFGTAWIHPDSELGKFGVATLALLGGYSADAVNRILMRFSETLSTFVQGSASEALKAKDEEIRRLRMELESARTRPAAQPETDHSHGHNHDDAKGRAESEAQS